MKLQTCYLDMDGPLANFHLAAVRAHIYAGKRFPNLHSSPSPLELSADALFRRWPKGVSCQKVVCPDIPDVVDDYWGDVMIPFWQPIDHDPLFWTKIPPMLYAKELWSLVHDFFTDVRITTTPHTNPLSYSGKRAWLAANFPKAAEPIYCKEKWRLCHPGDVLIDDYERHVITWREECQLRYGIPGKAVLYPAVWNEQHAQAFNPIACIERILNLYTSNGSTNAQEH